MPDEPESTAEPQKVKEVSPPVGSMKTGNEAAEAKSRQELTAEEQMALYEDELKESDWGHQPC